MLSYYVMYDLINNLEDKYKEQFTSLDRMFFSANYIKMLDFYNILSLKSNPYNLKNKLEDETKRNLSLNFLVNRAKELDYQQSTIFLAYGLIVNKTINDVTKPYYDSLCGTGNDIKTIKRKQKLERIIGYNLRDMFVSKNKEYRKVPTTFTATDEELDSIVELFTNVYKFSNTKDIILRCQKDFKFYYNQNINFLFFKIKYYKFLDRFSKSSVAMRPALRTKLYKKKYDYLNKNNRKWLNPYTGEYETTSFLDIYQNIIDEINIAVDKLNKVIFYAEKNTSILEEKTFTVLSSKLVNPIFKRKTIFKTKVKQNELKNDKE